MTASKTPKPPPSRIRDLFVADVTRDIPPVVYFHEQSPEKIAVEVGEYIITGGHSDGARAKNANPEGIHESYVKLLRGIEAELDKPGGPELPTCWISGFYGSGKSSFAKLLGLALDGMELPDGRAVASALLDRDHTPRRQELVDAWAALRAKIEPMAVVFDIGGVARDGEHIHTAAVRMVQRRLQYCSTDPIVADFELRLERDGQWKRFEQVARETLGAPWAEFKDRQLAEDAFSQVMHAMFPERYVDPMAWFVARAGTHARAESPDEAVKAIGDMLRHRRPNVRPTLFLVVDEVSQYVLHHNDRTDRLRAFASALGAVLRGQVWLVALGQQKIDEGAGESFLAWAKDRFPPRLRVHLANTNIRDVVHRRLLHKTREAEALLRDLFLKHRADLKLFAYGCDDTTPDDFAEVYPLLPGHVDLIMQITSALRTRSARSQGDDQAIRGLLQLLGELFRARSLAEAEVGRLITLDEIYEVQHTALDSETQSSMGRILAECAGDTSGLLVRVAKAVAMLEQIQETVPTTADLVARCLYDRIDRGNQTQAITDALEELRRRNLLSYSEKQGYKVQSTAGEEWERERREIGVSGEALGEMIEEALRLLLGDAERPRLQTRPFPWRGLFGDGDRIQDALLVDPRDEAALTVDFRVLAATERGESTWVRRSGEEALRDRLVWVAGDRDLVRDAARDLGRSKAMVKRFAPRRESLPTARRHLLDHESDRAEELAGRLKRAVADALMAGQIYFRSVPLGPTTLGAAFQSALVAAGTRVLPEVYPHFITTALTPAEVAQLLDKDLTGVSPKLVHELKILEIDRGRYEPTCGGLVPIQVGDKISADDGVTGNALLAHFGAPPYGYTANVVRACVAGLLRAGRIQIQTEDGKVLTGTRDPGTRDLFEKDRLFRRATILKAGDGGVSTQIKAKIAKLFERTYGDEVQRDDEAIADVVATRFPGTAQELREVLGRLGRLPDGRPPPRALVELQTALEECLRVVRQTRPAVQQVKRHLDALGDGFKLLAILRAELTDAALADVTLAATIRDHHGAQLREAGALDGDGEAALQRIADHLAGERPWVAIGARAPDIDLVRGAYERERQRRLEHQQERIEQARAQIRRRDGFATLSADKSARVLAGFQRVATDTDAQAIAPSLVALDAPFQVALRQAEEEAGARLDELLSQGDRPVIRRFELAEGLRNREIKSEADVESVLEVLRARLLEQVRAGVRVRLT